MDEKADTNSAIAYYQWGVRNIEKRPTQAAAAFYWASRLAPAWADPYYGQATALLLANRDRLLRYILRDKAILTSKETAQIDSLFHEAYTRNPLLISRLDLHVFDEYMRRATGRDNVGLFRSRTGNAETDAWMAYMQGNYPAATRYYATAIKRDPDEPGLHVERARAFAALAQTDSALSEMMKALEKMHSLEKERLERAFESRAMFEHSVAQLHVQRGEDSLARSAYERALVNDLSFHAAHAGLADLAMRRGDTATAVREYQQAIELRPADGALHTGLALALIQANRQAEASQALERAIELEPHFAQPYFFLARLLDYAEFTTEAIAEYEAFLQRAALVMPEREWVQNRIAELRAPAP